MMPREMERCQVRNVIVGSHNPDKLAVLRGLLGGVATVVAPPFPGNPIDEEVGPTVAAIASEKARIWSRWLQEHGVSEPVVATDGGLIVPALRTRWNPIYTRRFAGERGTPVERARALLDLSEHLRWDHRSIGWIEAASVAFPDEEPATFVAESPPGVLALTISEHDFPDGRGFWIPSVWLCPEYGLKRLVDLSAAQRAARPDHWDRLGEQLRQYLISRFAET